MTPAAPAGHRGMVHEVAIYSSDDEFLGVVVPFLQGGLEIGAPTVVALANRTPSWCAQRCRIRRACRSWAINTSGRPA
jgi:hypothetical protein